MKRFLKFIAAIVGILVLLIVVAAIVLPLIINPNQFKPRIVQAVKERTGRELTLQGNLHLSVFPWIGLKLGKTELSNAPGFGKRPFARVNAVDVSVALLPLLHKQLVVRKIELDGLELNLARDRGGRTNWADMVKASEHSREQQAQIPARSSSPASVVGALASARVDDGIDINDGTFRWDDARSGQSYSIDQLTLQTSTVAAHVPIELHLAFDLHSGKPMLRTRVDLRSELTVDPNQQTMHAKNTVLKVGPLIAHGDLHGERLLQDPVIRGDITIANFNLRQLLKQLGVHYTPVDSKALDRASWSGHVRGTSNGVFVEKLDTRLDDSKLTGSASVRFGAVPAINFNLSLNKIDLDRYLPKAKNSKAAQNQGGAAALVVPVPLVRKLDAHGSLQIGELKAFGIKSTNVALLLAAKHGLATVGPDTAQLYGGRYLGNTKIDVRHGAPRFSMDERLRGVQLGDLLKDMGIFDRFRGIGDVQLHLKARGMNSSDIRHSLAGTVSVAVNNGSLQGVDVYNTIVGSCQTGTYVPGNSNAATPFADLHATATLSHGVVDNRDLRVSGKLLFAKGSGTINLGRGTIDYLTEIRLMQQTSCPTSIFHIPLRGKIADLSASKIIHDAAAYEVQQAVQRAAQQKINQEKAKIQQNLKQQILKQFGQ